MTYKLGQTVYHKDCYNYCEALKIVGIREDLLELKGDYSGGTHNVSQTDWLSIEGTSTIYDYSTKKTYKDRVIAISNNSSLIVDSVKELIEIGKYFTKDI